MKTLIKAAALVASSLSSALAIAANADSIYFGGTIITVDDKAPSAEAVAVKGGKIVAVGSLKEVFFREKGKSTNLHDLKGQVLAPGFVDGHSHFSEVGLQTISANLLSPPDGPVKTIPELQQVMREFIATSTMIPAHGIAIGLNYDDSQLAEGRHPTRLELDAISTGIPILVVHQSGHFGTMNSKALEKAGWTKTSVNPDGGVIRREADGKTPNGVVEEVALFQTLGKLVPQFSRNEVVAQLKAAQAIYIANGFTTVQDGKTQPAALKILPELAKEGLLKIDIVSYPDLVVLSKDPVLHGQLMSRYYTDHFRIGGVKLTLDGSPQGKSAYFTKPYFKVPEGQKTDYAGYPAFTDAKLAEWTNLAYKSNWQLLAHVSGDAAGDQLIKAVRAAQMAYPGTDRRTVMVHGHFTRPDQVLALKELGIFASLFPLHTFNWGDYHRTSVVGPPRAENISPAGWLLKQGMAFSIHSDAPVVFPNSMQLIGTAVNRTTRSGYLLGPEHRLTPLQALHAMTLWPAYQHFEERSKGSLEVGKRADMVVLSANPLTVPPATLSQIKVVETIKDGTSIYKQGAALALPETNNPPSQNSLDKTSNDGEPTSEQPAEGTIVPG